MIYKYFLRFLFSILVLECSFQENTDIILKTERILDPNKVNISETLASLKKTNTWYKTYPKLKGIPDSLTNVSFLYTRVNYDQVAFQGYKTGKLEKDFFEHLIIKWGVDTTKCFDRPIYSYICALTGKTNNSWYYMFDNNADYDLSDEKIHSFRLLGNMFYSNLVHTVEFERYIAKKIVKDSVKFEITFARQTTDSLLDRIKIEYQEYSRTFLRLNNEDISIEIYPDYLRYDENPEIKFINSDSTLKTKTFSIGDFVEFSNSFYKISEVSEDGRNLILQKENEKQNELFSTQIGFKALPITGFTINKEILSLSDFRGKFLLLYFWNSTCASSVFSLKKSINLIYKEYAGDNFAMLGIAVDEYKKIKKIVEEYNIQWPQIITKGDSKICRDYRIYRYPTVYLINPNGEIIKDEDEMSFRTLKEYQEILEIYLK